MINNYIFKKLLNFAIILSVGDTYCLAGLKNLNNTCYMNAALQCLFACEPLNNIIEVMSVNSLPMNNSIIKEYYTLLQKHQQERSNSIEPTGFLNCARVGSAGIQQDADEFIDNFFQNVFIPLIDKKAKNKLELDIESRIKKFFSFDLKVIQTCSDSTNYAIPDGPYYKLTIALPERILSLYDNNASREIKKAAHVSLEEILKNFYAVENIPATEHVRCGPKPSLLVTQKRQEFKNLPEVLLVVPKIFGFKKDGSSFKIISRITYNMKLIELSSESGDKKYKLFGCVIHMGDTLTSGHYVSVVRYGTHWFFCNDSVVTAITEQQAQAYIEGRDGAINGNAYIYFFENINKVHNNVPQAKNVDFNTLFVELHKKFNELYVASKILFT